MYKFIILLVFPYFVFSLNLSFDEICSSNNDEKIATQIIRNSCGRKNGVLGTLNTRTMTCVTSSRRFQELLREQDWSQKKLNFITYLISQGHSDRNSYHSGYGIQKRIYSSKELYNKRSIRNHVPQTLKEAQEIVNTIRERNGLRNIDSIVLPESCDFFELKFSETREEDIATEDEAKINFETKSVEDESETEAGTSCVAGNCTPSIDSSLDSLKDPTIALLEQRISELKDKDRKRKKDMDKDIALDLESCKKKEDQWSQISKTNICYLLESLHSHHSAMERMIQYNQKIQSQIWNLVQKQSLNTFNNYSSISTMMSQSHFFPQTQPQQNLELMNQFVGIQNDPKLNQILNQNNSILSKYNGVVGRFDAIIDLNKSGNYHPSNFYNSLQKHLNVLENSLIPSSF